jgi:SAM-dependent methyltransferase
MPALVGGIEPSRGFLNVARRNLTGQVLLAQASAAAISIDHAAVDVVVSGLVLNFIPDPQAALREMARVTRREGTVAAYVWDYAEKMEILRLFWDAAVDLDPNLARLDEGARFPLCRPEALEDLFSRAGLAEIEVTAIDFAAHFESFDDYWQPFLGGQGPAPTYVAGLDVMERANLRGRLEESLPRQNDGSIWLNARAWAVKGVKSEIK